jgi:YidC/Oxa1 family membrane protein insertase
MAAELMEIYKENKVNPFASCLPLLIQLPIFLALYQVLRDGLGEVDAELLYPFISNPEALNPMFLGAIDLTLISIPFAVGTAVFQYFQAKQALGRRPEKEVKDSSGAMDENMAANMGKMMMYFIPAFTLVLGVTSLPGGVMLYWMTTTLLTIILYHVFLGKKKEEKAK